MRHIITKAQAVGKKAAELRQAVQSLPGQAAKIREAVTMTGGELHQLRAEVQSSINGLRVDNEDRLLKTMREINDHAEVFADAGYALAGMDLDLALNQRLAVHLDRVEEVPQSALRSLATRQSVESIRSILGGIAKAEETAANVELSALSYTGVIIHVGPLPMIRMLWRDLESAQSQVELSSVPAVSTFASTSAPAPIPSPQPISAPASPPLGSIFEPRPFPGAPIRVSSSSPSEPIPALASAAHASPSAPTPNNASAWSSDALKRFKQMPGSSKYGR
jgi:hypothetical protein